MNNVPSTDDRLCDFCNDTTALLYCRADSAKLCFSCDKEVHSTNPLFKKHVRCLLCDVCSSSPCSIFCSTESAVLCQNCDWEAHKQVGPVHDRRPLEGFCGCPSVSELLGSLGFDDDDVGKIKKSLVYGGNGMRSEEEVLDYLVWETPAFVSLDDLIVSGEGDGDGDGDGGCDRSLQALGVPPLPKNRNATCGKHKEEILSQLREMAKTEPDFDGSHEELEAGAQYQPQVPGKDQLRGSRNYTENKAEKISVPTFEEANSLKWGDYTGGFQDEGLSSNFIGSFVEMNHLVPDKDSDAGDTSAIAHGFQEVHSSDPMDLKPLQVPVKTGMRELNSQERDSAISRYKEKKKTRRYEKQIRYESRKVRAEGRTRIKGRFAKMTH